MADCVTNRKPCPVLKVGVQDRFGEVGKLDYLQKELHLTKEDIVRRAKEAIALKNG